MSPRPPRVVELAEVPEFCAGALSNGDEFLARLAMDRAGLAGLLLSWSMRLLDTPAIAGHS